MRIPSLLLVSMLSAGCFSTKQKIGPPPPMSVESAREAVRKAISEDKHWMDEKKEFHACCATASEIQIQTHGASYVHTTPKGSTVVRLSFDEPIDTYDTFRPPMLILAPCARLGGYQGDMPIGSGTSNGLYWARKKEDVIAFAHAYNTLVAHKKQHGEEEFTELAKRWQAMNPKPPLSEGADKHRILAENAFREKNLPKAIRHYESALETDPTWPDGNFNLALLYGETNEFRLAAFFMKRYLALVPDSKDAKAARERLVIWEDKAGRAAP